MTAFVASSSGFLFRSALRRATARAVAVLTASLLAACGGGDADPPPPPESGAPVPVAVAPTITQQPADSTVGNGQPASFSVAASGTAPLRYQWRRNGADVAGATATTYSLATVALADSGATFAVVVSNAAGSVASRDAVLTVTAAAPVLTITTQPASASVTTGSSASFSLAATCSSGTLAVQWQRAAAGAASPFADIAGATATTYSVTAAAADTGARFRAQLTCSGQAATTSAVAVLTVGTAATSVTLAALNVTGTGAMADIGYLNGIVQDTSGSWSITTGQTRIRRLRADLSGIDIVAGTGASGNADGPAATATFAGLVALARDTADNLYATQINGAVRRIAANGAVTTVLPAGGFSLVYAAGIAHGPDGDLYIADWSQRIYRLTTAGALSVYAGTGVGGFADGPAATAQFDRPQGIAVAANGDVYVADRNNHRIRRILRSGNAAGLVETVAGDGTTAVLPFPEGLLLRGTTLAVRDNFTLKEIDAGTGTITTLAGGTVVGYADGTGSAARFRPGSPGIAPGPGGGYIVADNQLNPFVYFRLATVTAGGDVRTLAHSYLVSNTPDGTALMAQRPINDIIGLGIDSSGRVLVADVRSEVRRVDSAGTVTTIAGLMDARGPFDGVGSAGQFYQPWSIVGTATGAAYVSDRYRIRRIAADNTVTTVAGDYNDTGNVNANGTAARFGENLFLALGPGGDLFVADAYFPPAVRRIDAAGNVTQYSALQGVRRIAFAADGTLYAISGGNLLRRSADLTQTTTVAGPNVFYMDVDPATGTVYYLEASGALYAVAPGGTPQLLLPKVTGPSVFGSTNPSLGTVGEIRDLRYKAPKQLVIGNTQEGLLLVTLP